MNIGIIAPPWVPVPPPAYGGTEAVIDRLARGLVDAGHRVLLWTTGDATCPVPRGHVLDTPFDGLMGIAAIELQHVVAGYEAMASWGADVIHDHTLTGPAYARGVIPVPVVTTNHGPFNAELSALYGAIGADVPVIAISQHHADSAGDVPVATMIHHGLDADRYPYGDGEGDDRGPFLLFLGRMSPEKGARRAALAARRAGQRLVIAAKMRERAEREYFESEVAPLLDDDVVYVGEVGETAKIALLRRARALVNPILWPEPFGLVMIEAMACGTPVLAYRSGSVPEIVVDGVTGFVCDDLDEIVERIGRIDELDRRACRRRVERHFTTQRMVEDHVALYRSVLVGKPSRAEVAA